MSRDDPLPSWYLEGVEVVTEERIRVRYGETDMMGHAYYGNYLFWLEQARGAWCRDRGFTYLSLEQMGFRLPVVEVWVRYKGEVKYDEWVTIRVWISEKKRAALKFAYEIYNESLGKVVSEAYTWHVYVGGEMKAVTIPEEVTKMLERDPAMFERLP